MKLIVITYVLILSNANIGKTRTIHNDPDIDERDESDMEELGYDEGEGKGAPLGADPAEVEAALAIDLKTQDPPGVNHIKDEHEDDAKKHHSKRFIQGDILLTKEEAEGEQFPEGENRNAAVNPNMLWKKVNGLAHVPYVISSSYSPTERANILRAVKELEDKTCIRYGIAFINYHVIKMFFL